MDVSLSAVIFSFSKLKRSIKSCFTPVREHIFIKAYLWTNQQSLKTGSINIFLSSTTISKNHKIFLIQVLLLIAKKKIEHLVKKTETRKHEGYKALKHPRKVTTRSPNHRIRSI